MSLLACNMRFKSFFSISYHFVVKEASFGAGMELSELPKASSVKLTNVVFCLHGPLNVTELHTSVFKWLISSLTR